MTSRTVSPAADPVDAALSVLRGDGGRATPARRLLLSVLTENRGHRTAEEIAADVQARAPGINLSTIYRNLDELCRLGIADRTRLGDGPAAYHLAAGHAHLSCQDCGTITEIPASLLDELAVVVRGRYGFAVSPHRFAITGRCAQCQQAPAAGTART